MNRCIDTAGLVAGDCGGRHRHAQLGASQEGT